jgi:DNA helicase TIP49 (TBP-interacting protein)
MRQIKAVQAMGLSVSAVEADHVSGKVIVFVGKPNDGSPAGAGNALDKWMVAHADPA